MNTVFHLSVGPEVGLMKMVNREEKYDVTSPW